MSNSETLTLIEGEFSGEEAREILLNIFSSKIHFHEVKNFSSQERFGKQDEIAVKRIPALKAEVLKLTDIISEAISQGRKLVISSDIKIVVLDEVTA